MRVPRLLLAPVLLIAITLTGFWFYAAHRVGDALDAWMTSERAQGRVWTCPNRSLTGFPLSLRLRCDHPSFAGRVLEDEVAASLGGFEVGASLVDPYHATATLAAPLLYKTADGRVDATLTWARAGAVVGGLPARFASVTISGTDFALKDAGEPPNAPPRGAASGTFTLHRVARVPTPTVEFAIALDGAAMPELDQLVGGPPELASVALTGRLTHAVFQDDPTTAALIERWRIAGGDLALWSARIARGSSEADASGTLGIDATHRLAGKLDAKFVGLGPILTRFGINPAITNAGALLTSLFGKRSPNEPVEADTIKMPIRFQDGRLGVGPILTPVTLPPLY